MSWFKVDDKLWGHPKWLATPIRSRGLWVTAGAWCADHEQDGLVPRHVLPILGATVRDASGLVTAGLWTAVDTGWAFRDWEDFQPTREQKEAEREAARERMRAGRERKAALRSEGVRPNIGEVQAQFGRSSEDVRSTPTRPDPTRPLEETSSLLPLPPPDLADPPRPDDDDAPKPRRKPERPLPASWAPNARHHEIANEKRIDITASVVAFRNHAETHDRRARDWDAAFRTWLNKTITPTTTPGTSFWDKKVTHD